MEPGWSEIVQGVFQGFIGDDLVRLTIVVRPFENEWLC